MCMRTYARMRRMHPSVGVRARNGGGVERWAAKGGDLHLGITVDMYVCLCVCVCVCVRAYARMHTCMRALVECISACVGVGVGACARGGSGRALRVTMYVYVCMYACM